MRDVVQAAEPIAGTLLYFLVLIDLLLTVLYARLGGRGVAKLGAGFLASAIGHGVRRALVGLANVSGRRNAVMSFCGPITLLLLPFAWTWLLTLGSALVIHPRL